MNKNNDFSSLLNKLQDLYSRIVSIILTTRLASYQNNNNHNLDIENKLIEKINKIRVNNKSTHNTLLKETPKNKEQHDSTSSLDYTSKVSTRTLSDLAKYFKSKAIGSELNLEMSEKLKKSTWEHIHNSIRFAHLGDDTAAKINAGIANNALKEAAHFMSAEEFQLFYNEIEQVIKHHE